MGRRTGKKNRPPQRREPDHRPNSVAPASLGRNASGETSAVGGAAGDRASSSPARATVLAVCGLLLLAVVLVFAQTLGHGFVNCDDPALIYQNPQLARGLTPSGIAWAFTNVDGYFWFPVTWLSYLADVQFFGLQPWGFHLTNVLVHAASTVLLFLVLWRMTGDLWPSALATALFAIHPLRAESVAWAAERKDVVGMLFFLLTLAAYVGYTRRPSSVARYLAVLALYAVHLMAKPLAVTLPMLLLLLDYWPLGRLRPARTGPLAIVKTFLGNGRLLLEKVPLLLLAIGFSIVTHFAHGDDVISLDILPVSLRISNALVCYMVYVRQFFCPTGLVAIYPYPEGGIPFWQMAVALLLLLTITTVALAAWRRCPYLFVGWLWYLGTFVPMIGLLQICGYAMADRFTYLPQIGLCIAVAWGVAAVAAAWPRLRWLYGAGAAAVLLVLLGGNWQQTTYWRDSQALWLRDLTCTSNNKYAPNNYGDALMAQGRTAEAIPYFRESLRIDSYFPTAHSNLAVALANTGQLDEALDHLRRALEIYPKQPGAANNLATLLRLTGRTAEAIAEYEKLLRGQPQDPENHVNLAVALRAAGRNREAIDQLQQALQLDPGSARAHDELGDLFSKQGDPAAAAAHWRQAVWLQPGQLATLHRLAWLLATSPDAAVRNGPEAIGLAERAQGLSMGQDPAIVGTLAAAYAEAGHFAEAVATADRAIALATQRQDAALVKTLQSQRKLYQTQTPYREPAAQPRP
jgi:protein O-mannosyl-transferase